MARRVVPVHPARRDASVRVTIYNGKPFVTSDLDVAYKACQQVGLSAVQVEHDDFCWQVWAEVVDMGVVKAKGGALIDALRSLFGQILDAK